MAGWPPAGQIRQSPEINQVSAYQQGIVGEGSQLSEVITRQTIGAAIDAQYTGVWIISGQLTGRAPRAAACIQNQRPAMRLIKPLRLLKGRPGMLGNGPLPLIVERALNMVREVGMQVCLRRVYRRGVGEHGNV